MGNTLLAADTAPGVWLHDGDDTNTSSLIVNSSHVALILQQNHREHCCTAVIDFEVVDSDMSMTDTAYSSKYEFCTAVSVFPSVYLYIRVLVQNQ